MKQHTGKLSDAIEDDGRSAARDAMKRVMRPASRAYRGGPTTGDGPPCPVEGHGRTMMLGRGPWCPHQSHDAERIKRSEGYTESIAVNVLPDLDIGELS